MHSSASLPCNASAHRRTRCSRYIAAPLASRCLAFVLTLVLIGGSVQNAWAGCCDDFWSCAAAVATGGLSCVVQGLIDTVNNLAHKVGDLRNQINAMSSDVAHHAQQGVNDAADALQQETQNALNQQKQALDSAQRVVNEENIKRSRTEVLSKTTVNGPSSGISNQPASSNQPSNTVHPKANNSNTTARETGLPAPTPSSPRITGANAAASAGLVPANLTEIQEELQRALQIIENREQVSMKRAQTIGNKANAAKNQAANGVNIGLSLASRLAVAPLDGLVDWLKDLAAHPDKIFDPTSIIDSEVDTITNNLNNTLDQIANAVTSDANQTMQSAESDYDEIQKEQEQIKLIAEKMETLHRERTKEALQDLEKLVSLQMNRAGAQMLAVGGTGGARAPFNTILMRISTSKQQALALPQQRIQEVKVQVAQLKTIRSQARNLRASLPSYQQSFSQKLDTYFAGKSASDAARQRDQLIAEARTHFANDPHTRDAVIKLLSDEAGRRISPSRVRVGG